MIHFCIALESLVFIADTTDTLQTYHTDPPHSLSGGFDDVVGSPVKRTLLLAGRKCVIVAFPFAEALMSIISATGCKITVFSNMSLSVITAVCRSLGWFSTKASIRFVELPRMHIGCPTSPVKFLKLTPAELATVVVIDTPIMTGTDWQTSSLTSTDQVIAVLHKKIPRNRWEMKKLLADERKKRLEYEISTCSGLSEQEPIAASHQTGVDDNCARQEQSNSCSKTLLTDPTKGVCPIDFVSIASRSTALLPVLCRCERVIEAFVGCCAHRGLPEIMAELNFSLFRGLRFASAHKHRSLSEQTALSIIRCGGQIVERPVVEREKTKDVGERPGATALLADYFIEDDDEQANSDDESPVATVDDAAAVDEEQNSKRVVVFRDWIFACKASLCLLPPIELIVAMDSANISLDEGVVEDLSCYCVAHLLMAFAPPLYAPGLQWNHFASFMQRCNVSLRCLEDDALMEAMGDLLLFDKAPRDVEGNRGAVAPFEAVQRRRGLFSHVHWLTAVPRADFSRIVDESAPFAPKRTPAEVANFIHRAQCEQQLAETCSTTLIADGRCVMSDQAFPYGVTVHSSDGIKCTA